MTVATIRTTHAAALRTFYGIEPSALTDAQVVAWFHLHAADSEPARTFRDAGGAHLLRG